MTLSIQWNLVEYDAEMKQAKFIQSTRKNSLRLSNAFRFRDNEKDVMMKTNLAFILADICQSEQKQIWTKPE